MSATLNLSASDAVGVTAYFVSSSSTAPAPGAPGWTAVGPTPSYNGSVGYTLTSGDGTKTVYAWYKDAANNVSATASASIILDQTAPAGGTLSATPGSNQVALSWPGFTDAGSGLATTNPYPYKLTFTTNGIPASCAHGTQIYLGTATSYTHTGLSNGTTYYYRLCATDKAGNTSADAWAMATPQAGDTLAPTGSLAINSGAAYTNLTSVDLDSLGQRRCRRHRLLRVLQLHGPRAGRAGLDRRGPDALLQRQRRRLTLPSGDGTKTVYAWYKDAANNVSATASASIILDQIAPAGGTLSATPSSNQVALSWPGFSDSGSGLATTNPYKLVFATGASPVLLHQRHPALPVLGTATSYTHTGLTNGTTYYYRVCATDNAGNTSAGATASATPQNGDTTPPAGSLAINSGAAYTNPTSVTLNLSASDAVGVTGYFVSSSSTAPAPGAPGWTAVGPTPSYNGSVGGYHPDLRRRHQDRLRLVQGRGQ